MTFTRRVCAAALLSAIAFGAQAAATSYGVRNFDFDAGFPPGLPPPDPSPIMFGDPFNNGNPLTGAQKSIDGGITVTPASYSVVNNGFSPGSETNPSDWAGATFGVGRLTLSAADARDVGPNSLTLAGLTNFQNRLTVHDVAGQPLLRSTSSFETRSVWDFVTPDANSYYGLRLSDNPGAGASYNDLLDLRVTLGGDGLPKLNLRRLTFDGTTTTSTSYANIDLQTRLGAIGKTLADVGYIYFEFHYNYFGVGSSGNGVLAAFNVLDGAGNDLLNIHLRNGDGSPRIFSLFDGEDFTRPSVGANWQLEPIPEPGTYAMMLLGLGTVAFVARRRRA